MKKPLLLILILFPIFVFGQEKVKEKEAAKEPEKKDPAQEELQKKVEQTFADIEPGDLEAGVLKVRIQGTVSLSYVFAESPESFVITYNFSVEDFIRNKVEVKTGEAEIRAQVKGALAKWPSGECQLMITVGKIPYEVIFNRVKEDEARIDLKFKNSILETWESKCKFSDAGGREFNTVGTPEKWLDSALTKTQPPLRRMLIKFPEGSTPSSVDFNIERHLIPDVPLGSVEIEGKGKLELIPKS